MSRRKLLLVNPVNAHRVGLTFNPSSRFPPLALGIIAALIPDDWEMEYGLNPKDPKDASRDTDGDEHSNLDEFEEGTDPTDETSKPSSTGDFIRKYWLFIILGGAVVVCGLVAILLKRRA